MPNTGFGVLFEFIYNILSFIALFLFNFVFDVYDL